MKKDARLRSFLVRFGLLLACILAAWQPTLSQAGGDSQPAQDQSKPGYELRVTSNLVLVRVVVRDAQGKPVDGLRKEDFRLFDDGKQQTIAQFEVQAPASEIPTAAQASFPTHFIALFFDDVDTSRDFLNSARDAADEFLQHNLGAADRAALVTTSGRNNVDFTADRNQLHSALFKIAPNEHGVDPRLQAWYNFQVLELLVERMAEMPGQRSIILVSTGFMSGTQQARVNAIIDRALRSQIVISSLDPRGLLPPNGGPEELVSPLPPVPFSTAPPQMHSSAARAPSGGPEVDSLDPDLLVAPETVLQEVADGTGGEYFHDNNELSAGFRRLSGAAQLYYILAFDPKDLKMDGRYHSLKVTLTEKRKGFNLQARRGYFAARPATSPQFEAEEVIRQALLSTAQTQQLPVALAAGLSPASNDARELRLAAHLDARPLHFHREGDHNLSTVTFVFGIFDQNGVLVGLQQRHARVNLLDQQLPELFKTGVDVDMTFQLKPGTYRIREVVTESEEHHMTTFSKDVMIR